MYLGEAAEGVGDHVCRHLARQSPVVTGGIAQAHGRGQVLAPGRDDWHDDPLPDLVLEARVDLPGAVAFLQSAQRQPFPFDDRLRRRAGPPAVHRVAAQQHRLVGVPRVETARRLDRFDLLDDVVGPDVRWLRVPAWQPAQEGDECLPHGIYPRGVAGVLAHQPRRGVREPEHRFLIDVAGAARDGDRVVGQHYGRNHQAVTAHCRAVASHPAAELPGEYPRQMVDPVQRILPVPAVDQPDLVAELEVRSPVLLLQEEDSVFADQDEVQVVPAWPAEFAAEDDLPRTGQVTGECLGRLLLARSLVIAHYDKFGHGYTL